jgi:hypothetical protein
MPFDREAMAVITATRKMRRTVRCRERSLRHAQTWDGITDQEIFERDGWRCQIPDCRYRSRKINRRYKYPDPRSPGIDHIVPLSLGGDDTSVNKRAAHHGCNMARGNRMGEEQLPLFGSVREPSRPVLVSGEGLSVRLCVCGQPVAPGRRAYCQDCIDARARRREESRKVLSPRACAWCGKTFIAWKAKCCSSLCSSNAYYYANRPEVLAKLAARYQERKNAVA